MHICLIHFIHIYLFRSTSTNDIMELLFHLYVQPSKMQGIFSFCKSRSEWYLFPQHLVYLLWLFPCLVLGFSVHFWLVALRSYWGCTWMMLFLGSVAGLFMFGCHSALLPPCVPDLHKTAGRPPRSEGITAVHSRTSLNFINTGRCTLPWW